MIAVTKTVRIESIERDVSVRELTTSGMRAMLKAREAIGDEPDIDPLEMLTVGDGLLLSDLPRLTDISTAEIDMITESELTQLVEESKRLNPRFFGQILGTLSRFVALSLSDNGASSSATSSPLLAPDTRAPGTTQ